MSGPRGLIGSLRRRGEGGLFGWELGYGVLECSALVALSGGTVEDPDSGVCLQLFEGGEGLRIDRNRLRLECRTGCGGSWCRLGGGGL